MDIDTRKNIGWFYTRWTIDPRDIEAVGNAIKSVCDDVHLYAIDKVNPDRIKMRNLVKSPCILFALCGTKNFRPPRGRVFDSAPISKARQAVIFRQHNVLHPWTAIYDPDEKYPEEKFGPAVIVKPIRGSRGKGIFVMETRLIEKYRDRLKRHSEDLKSPILIQQYIDTGERIAKYRVLLLFGAVMYALKGTSVEQRPVNLQPEFMTDKFVQSHGVEKDTVFCHEAEVLETARHVASALCEIPIIGVDLVREADSGDVYVIEANIGNTWHLSSESGVGTRRNVGGRGILEKEFDTWNVAARRLVEIARTHAI